MRGGFEHPEIDFKHNIEATRNLLDFIRQSKIKELVFSSSCAVYGEATIIPTPESYGPCKPISSYGATKLAGEALILVYSNYYNFKASIFRFANIVGKNCTHGVIADFLKKLKENPKKLDILGDGTQEKSYIDVSDCVAAMLLINSKSNISDIFNLGNVGRTSVKKIANMVIKSYGLKDVKINFTRGYQGRDWQGDIKQAELSIEKVFKLGWKNKYGSDEAIEKAIQEARKIN